LAIKTLQNKNFKNDIPPNDYEKNLANICVYEGITAARKVLRNAPMAEVMGDIALIGNTLDALVSMKQVGGLLISRRHNCIHWILIHFLMTEKPSEDLVVSQKVNKKVFRLTFVDLFSENRDFDGSEVSWAANQISRKYNLRRNIGPFISNLAEMYRKNKALNLFWNLNEDSYKYFISLDSKVLKDNVYFSMFNEKEDILAALLKKMEDKSSNSLTSALISTLNMATLTGDSALIDSLLPLLTPDQKFFFGLNVSKQIQDRILSNMETKEASQFIEPLIGFAFAGRNFQLIIDYWDKLPNVRHYWDISNTELFDIVNPESDN
jgi:hypothetical protein